MTAVPPVNDWTIDWDHHDPQWVDNPFPIWDELRSGCPVAHTEFLRAFASVSLWRTVAQHGTIGETDVEEGDTVMMAFPAACRDPDVFENADQVIIDRHLNRHVAFGAGIHRCLGSDLARLELNIAIEIWLRHLPMFELVPSADVTWAEGAIRGPRAIPVRL